MASILTSNEITITVQNENGTFKIEQVTVHPCSNKLITAEPTSAISKTNEITEVESNTTGNNTRSQIATKHKIPLSTDAEQISSSNFKTIKIRKKTFLMIFLQI